MPRQLERIRSIRAVDDTGNYYDVDHFVEYLIDQAAGADGPRTASLVRVNRQDAKQLDESTYEVLATGLRLRRVSARSQNAAN